MDKEHESYVGRNVSVRYFIKLVMERKFLPPITKEKDVWIQFLTDAPEQNEPIKMGSSALKSAFTLNLNTRNELIIFKTLLLEKFISSWSESELSIWNWPSFDEKQVERVLRLVSVIQLRNLKTYSTKPEDVGQIWYVLVDVHFMLQSTE
jgi:hypothetical protein